MKDKAGKIAAFMLETGSGAVTFKDGKFSRADGKSVTIQEVALAAYVAKTLPPDTEPGLSATYFFEPKNFTFPFGTHIAVVEIDRETGETLVGEVPAYSVVVPGTMAGKRSNSGEATPNLYCAVIVKRVDEKTRAKTSINELLRD